MAENRLARQVENRDAAKRPQAWTPPSVLPDPAPQDGWVFRWIRTSMMGQLDPTNMSAKRREGWEAVKAADHPELMYMADNNNPNNRFKDNVEIGGLVLCKAPVEMLAQRNAYYKQQADSQTEAIDNNFMRQKDDRSNMSLFSERKSNVSFGRGDKS